MGRAPKVYHKSAKRVTVFSGFTQFEESEAFWNVGRSPTKKNKNGAFLEPVSQISERPFLGSLNYSDKHSPTADSGRIWNHLNKATLDQLRNETIFDIFLVNKL